MLELKMKTNKSRWYTTGIHGQELDNIQELENISNGTMIFRYLGILLAIKNLKISSFAPFLDKIPAYISAWMSSSLLYVGRVVLLRAILQGVECFWLSSFLISATVTTKITRLLLSLPLAIYGIVVAWKDISLQKCEWWLDFKDIYRWNHVLLAQSLWNI